MAVGNVLGVAPMLGALAKNGGLTSTHALLPGSPAIDAGDAGACPATDQRGVKRPLDGQNDGDVACDIGAYEGIFVDSGLSLAVALNQPSHGPGETLALDVTAANPTGPEVPADVYPGFVLPASAGRRSGARAGTRSRS